MIGFEGEMVLTQKNIEEVVYELVGQEVFPLVEALKKMPNSSEFQLSAKIKLPVDVVRNLLYQLYNHNLVSFTRKKDKRKGWYIYYWVLNVDRIEYLVTDLKRKKLDRLKKRIEREQNTHFFTSDSRCVRVDFDQASDLDFKCPETGELLYQEDNSGIIEGIRKEIAELEKEVQKENAAEAEKEKARAAAETAPKKPETAKKKKKK